LVCPARLIRSVRCPSNLGFKSYKKSLEDIDLDIVSYPPRSFVSIDDIYSTDIGQVSKLSQGDPNLNLKSAAHSSRRLIEQVRILPQPILSYLIFPTLSLKTQSSVLWTMQMPL
jgi:hypothetical protein